MKLSLFALALLAIGGTSRAATLTLERKIALGGVKGRIDHFGYAAGTDRLFVAALGNDTVEVIDLKAGKVVHSIAGLSEPQGVVFVPESNRLFIANGGDGALRIYDGTTFAQVASVKLDDDADNVRYDNATKRVYVGYGGGAIGVVDAANGELVGTIAVGAHPESFQLEKQGGRLFINVPRTHSIAVADRAAGKVIGSWSPTAGGNYPMALDEADHRLVIGCRSPAGLLVFDTETGKEVARLGLHHDCDDVFLDPVRRLIYASCGEGFVDVFSLAGANRYALLESIKTESRGRTCFFTGDHLYLALPVRGSQGAEVWDFRIAAP